MWDRRASVGAVVLLAQLGALVWTGRARATETEPEAPLPSLDPRRPEIAPPPEPPRPTEGGEPGPDAPPPPPIDLLPPLALARAAGIDVPPRPRSSDPIERIEDRTDRDLRRELRRDAIRSGMVDGYFYELGRAMRADLEVDPLDMQADVFRGMSIPEMVVTELGRHGPRERPIDPRGTPLPDDRIPSGSTRLFDPEAVALQEMLDQQNFLNGHVTWHRCEVRVLQNTRGEIFDVQLLRSSGLPAVDHAALEAARHAVIEAPPPERIIEGRETLQSDWAIEVGDVATDPTQIGCTDPADFLGGGCAALGRGLLRTRVELIDVVDGMHPPDPE